jgi:hypothetical protein
LSGICAPSVWAETEKPNIVFILVDAPPIQLGTPDPYKPPEKSK